MAQTALDVVIVTFNSGDVLTGLLDSLQVALDGVTNARVIIADNDSHDDSVAIATRHPIGAHIVEVGYNAGYAAGINAATASHGRDCALLLLNADIRLQPDCVTNMLAELDGHDVGVVVPRTLHEDGTLSFSIRREPSLLTAWSDALLGGTLSGKFGLGEISYSPADYHRKHDIVAASGAILLVSRAARLAVGGWDERYFLYSEEIDYQRRVRDAGFAIRFVASAVCTHIGGESNVNPRLFALLTANRLRYFRRYHGRLETLLFRLALTVGAGLRLALGPAHRAALKATWISNAGLARLVPSARAAAALMKEP
jgi:N-acetylglucosaminyl-diphospho-decaprenol L-rhamnosyltransferase